MNPLLIAKLDGLFRCVFYTATGTATIAGTFYNPLGIAASSVASGTVTTTPQTFGAIMNTNFANIESFQGAVSSQVNLAFTGLKDGTINTNTNIMIGSLAPPLVIQVSGGFTLAPIGKQI